MQKQTLTAAQRRAASLEKFNKSLNREPTPSEVFKENNSYSLPISYVERELDRLFGVWERTNFTYKRVLNEIVGSVELRVFHPVLNTWITRVGVAAKAIQQKSGTPVEQFEKFKGITALERAAPALLSMCIKNAAKSLGKRFGRDLNRGAKNPDKVAPAVEGSFEPFLIKQCKRVCKKHTTAEELRADYDEDFALFNSVSLVFDAAVQMLEATNLTGLDAVLASSKKWSKNPHVIEIYEHYKTRF